MGESNVYPPFALSLSKGVPHAPGIGRGTCFDKLSTNGGYSRGGAEA